jgi:hypothetical protein
MIGKVSPHGQRVTGLIYYLFGAGRQAEHTDPHIIAGWRHPAELEPPLRDEGIRDFRNLAGLLQQPHDALGSRGTPRPVWHCSVRVAPDDRILSDAEWAQVACDVMHRTGLAPYGQEDDAVRWIAVRHAPDHIHLVAMLARQDGTRPQTWNDYFRVGEACRDAEQRFGLRRTAPRDRTAARRPTRPESEKARRHGWQEAPRLTLRRTVSTAAAGASSEQEFFARLDRAGVLVRKRFSTRNPGEVTGYAVALPHDTTRAGASVWFGGGKLAADLTLPKLRHRWQATGPGPGDRFTAAERAAIWEHAARTAAGAGEQIRNSAAADRAVAADAAWAAADTLHAAAAALGSRVLRQAADSYDRAARAPYGRIPAPGQPGNNLRRTARLLSTLPSVADVPRAETTLLMRFAKLAEAIAELREAQRLAAQAAAARRAAEQLRAAMPGYVTPPSSRRTRVRASVERSRAEFPFPPGTFRPGPSSPGKAESQPGARPVPSQGPSRPPGPAQKLV